MLIGTATLRQINGQQDKYGLFQESRNYRHSALLCLF